MEEQIALLGQTSTALFFFVLFFLFALMGVILWFGWWVTNRQGAKSPYTEQEMRRGEDLAYSAVDAIQKYLDAFADPLNPPIDIRRAAICQQTGRIFPESVNIFGVIKVDWSFLQKRCKGNWVSWGSLTTGQQDTIRFCHDSLEGYQLEESSTQQQPEEVDLYHATLSPGPLYVDLSTRMLLGWKKVPKTALEVLVLQRPYRLPSEEKEPPIEDQIIA